MLLLLVVEEILLLLLFSFSSVLAVESVELESLEEDVDVMEECGLSEDDKLKKKYNELQF